VRQTVRGTKLGEKKANVKRKLSGKLSSRIALANSPAWRNSLGSKKANAACAWVLRMQAVFGVLLSSFAREVAASAPAVRCKCSCSKDRNLNANFVQIVKKINTKSDFETGL
jgi:hypothetical protein